MALFEPVVQWVLYQEDDHRQPGKIVNLGDGAGMTRLGITSNNFGAYVAPNFFTDMSFTAAVVQAKKVYREHFWNLFHGDNIVANDCAAVLLSSSVNIRGGVSHSVKMLQQVLGVEQDGILGPKTVDELNSKDNRIVANMFRGAWENFYHELVAMNPAKAQFMDGWKARVWFPFPSDKVPDIYE
ncbi:putative Peptidoglycan domain protein [uncultured archaeon]|nr:putative Peptidoglycan domain protein [uncultured archaeon]